MTRQPGYRKARAAERREAKKEHGKNMYREYKKHHSTNADKPKVNKRTRRKSPALTQLERLGRGFLGG